MRSAYRRPQLLGLLLLAFGSAPLMGRAEPSADTDRVVATVGSTRIGAAEVQRRIRSLPSIQLASLGRTDQDRARQVLESLVIPEALFAVAAGTRRIDSEPDVRARIDEALRSARMRALLAGLQTSPDEVAQYYETHRDVFESPLRMGLWRILCASAEEAQTVLAEAKSGINAWRWKDMSREHSTDRATKWRGGDLGFVAADGSSTEAGLRVDPVLFAAADKVHDGELVPEPVEEGTGYAVVWRRESMPASRRSLDDEADGIKQVILRNKLHEAADELLRKLKSKTRIEVHPDLLATLDSFQSREGTALPAPASARRPPGSPQPSATPRGLR